MGILNEEGYINYPSAGDKQVFPMVLERTLYEVLSGFVNKI
jgi:hypothetical protein